jgi:hypothetical protein
MSEVSETGESILKDNTRQDEEIEIDKRDQLGLEQETYQ